MVSYGLGGGFKYCLFSSLVEMIQFSFVGTLEMKEAVAATIFCAQGGCRQGLQIFQLRKVRQIDPCFEHTRDDRLDEKKLIKTSNSNRFLECFWNTVEQF